VPSRRSLIVAVALALVAGSTLALTAASAAPPAPVACKTSAGACWKPPLNARWQYQLQPMAQYASTGGLNVDICAVPSTGGPCVRPAVFDFDLYDVDGVTPNTTGTAAVHTAGGKAICYVSAGTWEDWRPDAGQFPASVKGSKNGWPGERWLDIRQTSVLVPIMDARVAKCRQAGFDGVEWDNVDGYSNRSGFPLTYADQLAYNATLANLAHQYGLTVAIKNDVEQLADLGPYFDYAVNEQCQQYRECGAYDGPFTGAGKAVFQVEYKLSVAKFCPAANTANRNAILKDFDLFDTPYTPCR
jgi:hypothetical protein